MYSAHWARSRTFKHFWAGAQGLLLLAGGIFLLAAGAWSGDRELNAMGAPIVLLGAGLVWISVATMPFRVYERGMTLTWVPFLKGLRMQEVLVPSGDIVRVELDRAPYGREGLHSISITYHDARGVEDWQRLDHRHVEDPMAVLRAIRDVAPDALDGEARTFLSEEHWRDARAATRETPGAHLPGVVGVHVLMALSVLIPFALAVLIGDFGTDTLGRGGLVVTALTIVLLATTAEYGRRVFLRAVEAGARLSGDRLALPRSTTLDALLYTRGWYRLSEVVEARRALDPVTYLPRGRLVFVTGEEAEVRPPLLDALECRSEFEVVEGRLLYRGKASPRGPPLVAKSWSMATLWLLLALLTYVLTLALVDALPPVWTLVIERALGGLAATVVVLYIALQLSTRVRAAARDRASARVVVGPGAIRAPQLPSPLLYVPRKSIRSIRVVRDLSGPHLVLESNRGIMHLSLDLAHDLIKEGYPLEDELGLVIGPPPARLPTLGFS